MHGAFSSATVPGGDPLASAAPAVGVSSTAQGLVRQLMATVHPPSAMGAREKTCHHWAVRALPSSCDRRKQTDQKIEMNRSRYAY
jgi:hypothetical protein